MPRKLEFPYLDERLAMVEKPHGIAMHRSEINPSKLTLHLMVNEQLSGEAFVVNRLDWGTSGVLVMARDRAAARHCSLAFQNRQVEKDYLALVRGWPEPNELRVERELDGRAAITEVRVLERVELPWPNERYPSTRLSLVSAQPRTGVHHQIRRHLRHLSYPVVGDRQHGDSEVNRNLLERCGIRRLLLHSLRLSLPHPDTKLPVVGRSRWPGRLRGLLTQLGFSEELVKRLRDINYRPAND